MILITGNTGYIGTVMTNFFQKHPYRVIGLDSNYYKGIEFIHSEEMSFKQIIKDIRDVDEKDLEGITAIVHLKELRNFIMHTKISV